MQEKYTFDTVKDMDTADYIFIFGGVILFCFLMIKHDDLERRTFWILAFINASIWCCFIGRICVSMRLIADDSAVTFSRILKKRIAYSSIKSIDIRTEKRTYKTKKGMRRITHTYYTEIITFNCEDGDHSFAGRLDPALKTLPSLSRSTVVSPDDMTYSTFSRLKVYIEERINAG